MVDPRPTQPPEGGREGEGGGRRLHLVSGLLDFAPNQESNNHGHCGGTDSRDVARNSGDRVSDFGNHMFVGLDHIDCPADRCIYTDQTHSGGHCNCAR